MGSRIGVIISSLALLLIITLSLTPYAPQAAPAGKDSSSFSLVIHPAFYTQELWERGYLVEDPTMKELLSVMEERLAGLEARGVIPPAPQEFQGGEKAVKAFILVPPIATREDIESL